MHLDVHLVFVTNKYMPENLIQNIDLNNVPTHVAIIMDGNGRWAKKKGMKRAFGHQNAIKAVRSSIESCDDLGIPYLTLYAFSSENWNRPSEEVNMLMNLLVRTLKKELPTLQKYNIKLNTIGDTSSLPVKVYGQLEEVMDETKNNTKATLTLALSYGAKAEILKAVKQISQEVLDHELTVDGITEEVFKDHLYTKNMPDVDLMIRTSGETRISNFLLWQSAYAELYFTPVLWPDFRKEDFYKAIINYQQRERRFGKTTEQITS